VQTAKVEIKKLIIPKSTKTNQEKLCEANIIDDDVVIKSAYQTTRPLATISGKNNFISKNINHITKLSLDQKSY
jgi:hypothetical protein